jgi:hypothetical protein
MIYDSEFKFPDLAFSAFRVKYFENVFVLCAGRLKILDPF